MEPLWIEHDNELEELPAVVEAPKAQRPAKPILFEWDGKPVVSIDYHAAMDGYMMRFADGERMLLDKYAYAGELRALIDRARYEAISADPHEFRRQAQAHKALESLKRTLTWDTGLADLPGAAKPKWRDEHDQLIQKIEASTAANKSLLATLSGSMLPTPATTISITAQDRYGVAIAREDTPAHPRRLLTYFHPYELDQPREPYRTFIIARQGFTGINNAKRKAA